MFDIIYVFVLETRAHDYEADLEELRMSFNCDLLMPSLKCFCYILCPTPSLFRKRDQIQAFRDPEQTLPTKLYPQHGALFCTCHIFLLHPELSPGILKNLTLDF